METSKKEIFFDSHQKSKIFEKRVLFLILLLSLAFVFLISLVSAAEIKLSKEAYAPGETLQAEIYGNFIDGLKVENIYFYRERNIPIIYDILKSKDKYFLYALLPYHEGNYTLKIKNTRYETETGSSTADLVKEFKIKPTNETALTINPGFVVTREDFYIKVEANKNTNINIEFLGEKQNLSLIQGVENRLSFSVSEIKNYTETSIKIQDYSIPVFIFPGKSDEEIIKETGSFRFSPSKISATILKEEDYFFEVSLLNLGNKNITGIKLLSNTSDSDLTIIISPDSISKLEAGNEELIDITLNSEKKGNYSGSITASSGNLSTELKVNIEVTENKSQTSYEGPSYEESCANIGKICNLTERCQGNFTPTSDGFCCKGECLAEKKESENTWIYGVIIIIVVVAGLIFLSIYMKKKQKKSIDILKEREKNYEERMSPSEEVRGGLTKT